MITLDTFVEDVRRTGFSHHAVLIEGEHEAGIVRVRAFVEQQLNMPFVGNPDVWCYVGETLGIEEAREVRNRQGVRGFGSTSLTVNGRGRKVFVIAAHTMTSEAQNALLKVTEEPTEGTHLFFVVPHAEALLPTLRSRMTLVKLADASVAGDDPSALLAKAFLGAKTIAERLRLVKPLLDGKDKAGAAVFFDRLIFQIRAQGPLTSRERMKTLNELLSVRQHLATRSPSVKMLLEHVINILPLGE